MKKKTKINKSDIIKSLRKEFGLTWPLSENIVNFIFDTIKDSIQKDTRVSIHEFGSFTPYLTKPKPYYHLGTGELVINKPEKRVKFSPSDLLLK